ncbi:MAG: metallophosphoesterase [Bacteroidia bacterium]|nr:metallophosphoesterase [Bacteroidia bacterium]
MSGAVGYNIRYRVVSNPTWSTTTSAATSVTIASLSLSTDYEWQVQTDCGNSNLSSFSSSANFSTSAPSCNIPTGLVTYSITSVSAVLSWIDVSGAVSYNYRYRINGAPTWITSSSLSATSDVSGLTPGSIYEWQVQTVCSSSLSAFTPSMLFTTQPSAAYDTLISQGAVWKYYDLGTDLVTSWKGTGYNDALWSQGPSQLGYGDGDEATVVSYGPDPNNKYITTYFRKSFTILNPGQYLSLIFNLVRDDGAMVYLNGTEVYRSNMPAGTIAYNTFASTAISGTDESAWYSSNINTSLLVSGTNVIAVEMHQVNLTSSDISFNFRLLGSRVPFIVRGPYLQTLTPNSVLVCWQTDVASGSRVRCGLSPSNYTMNFYDAAPVTDHVIQINGLTAATKYYYTIENQTYVLQGDNNNYFYTAPVTETIVPVRIWAIGDFGNGSAGQTAVRDAYANYSGAANTNLWLWLGDNAYSDGTDAEYQAKVFNVYPQQFKNMPLYPALGNHDYANVGYQSSTALTSNFAYFSIVSVPTVAEAGGIASGTEKYYSYNYSNIHFISLDSYGVLNNPGSPMYNWLVSDLFDNRQRWTIVYFHHPPYTKGSHNSDTEAELIDMRQNIIPVLENYNVDLVLSGHSHANERTSLIRGHYGLSGTFNSSMIVQGGSGALPNPYVKAPPYWGTVYAVCGTSGQLSSTVQAGWPMPCMYYSNNTSNASLVIDVNGDQLDCKYLSSTGSIIDRFTIVKTGTSRESGEALKNDTENNLLAIYPNPLTNETYISYHLRGDESAEINLYNLSGEKVFSFTDGKQNQCAGKHEFKFSPLSLGIVPGVYFVRLITDENTSVQKVVFVK